MTRKEERLKAARDYVSGVTLSSPSNVIHFEAGAEWADEHPNLESLWHDVSIRPKENSEILVNWNIKDHSGYESYHTCAIENWDRFIEGYGVSKWAYIDDLLPKQFGISEQLKGGEK